ncbi:MAG TPA: LL-diaminopimelate aminotransferase [Elusimicrobiota bacterium]|nr:LL-diaminopimelate aminotransferase [Elusimicrobiota bacterium]
MDRKKRSNSGIKISQKLEQLPPYLFTRIKVLIGEAYKKNLDVIDLTMGNPDQPTPPHIVDRLVDTIQNHPRTHRYPQAKGMPRFRRAVSDHMKRRFGVSVDPESEVLTLVGSKEGIAHLASAYMDPGDVALVPVPAYPVHFNGVILAGGKVCPLPLTPENGFLPDYGKIPAKDLRKAKLLFLGYPNNPTTTVIEDEAFFKETIRFAKKHNLLVVYDNAYSEITFDGYRAPSFLEVPGARDVALEFHSFSKTYNMAGWRIGWACGKRELVAPLEKFKAFVDYGVPTFMQLAAVRALEGPQDCVRETVAVYQRRRDYFVDGLNKIGWNVAKPKATMYVWAPLPESVRAKGSMAFAEELLRETGVAVSPGVGFGQEGEGYVRFALVTHDQRFYDVLLRLRKFIGGASVKYGMPPKPKFYSPKNKS